MNTRTRSSTNRRPSSPLDRPIAYAVTDAPIPFLVNDAPVPYRVRVGTPSAEMRAFVVPQLGIEGTRFPPEAESGARLRVVAA